MHATERRISGGQRKVSGPVKRIETSHNDPTDSSPAIAEELIKENDMINEERGRLLLKILSVRDVSLPNIEEKNAKYNITLDNGVHCITTSMKPLHRTSTIEEEFELSVDNQLEFIITLKAKWPKTKQSTVIRKPVPAPHRDVRDTRSRSGFTKIFSSSKKRGVTPSSPQVSSIVTKEISTPDSWEGLLSNDGYFGRSYIDFSQYEKEVYGRSAVFEISCFNEWSRTSQKTRRSPYGICRLQLQMMFIPRIEANEILPRSIHEANEIIKSATNVQLPYMEGFLSQLGGDCKYWRRRYFTLTNTTLTAHSESSRKPRATINLSKAVKVVDDKSSLTQPTIVVGSNRRKSAFAEQEEGFLFVEEAFRLRFANGEIIDFYADSREAKKKWVTVLTETIGAKIPLRSPWVEQVLKSL